MITKQLNSINDKALLYVWNVWIFNDVVKICKIVKFIIIEQINDDIPIT